MAKNPTTDQLLIAYQEGEKKGREGEQLKIANDALYPSSPGRNDWMKEIDTGPSDPKPGDVLFNEEELPGGAKQLGFEWLVKQLQINPDQIAGALLPGERGSSNTGGLKGMRPSDVERYLNENGITGPAAEKIWKKYKGLQGGVDLPLAQVDYNKNMPQGYKDWSEQLKEIMGTKGGPDFLKELLIHTGKYPKA